MHADGRDWKFLGIFGKNKEEWAVIDLACMRNSVTIVPFFDSLGPEALSFVINQTELTTMVVEKNNFELLVKLKTTKCPSLQNIVLFEDATPEQKAKAQENGLTLYDYKSVIEAGRQHPEVTLNDPEPETIYMFCYTSGTTGDPKGAMMSHAGFVATQHLHEYAKLPFDDTDVSISYLPLAHIFEQCNFVFSLATGYAHGFYSGDPLKLLDDIATLKPTFFCSVPRILNRVHAKIMDGVNSAGGFKKYLFNKAVADKTYNLMNKGQFTYKVYDAVVFKKVRELFGGNLKFLITASAPISGEVLTFFKIALGIHVYEVYG
jgi:long-chain acyl-CoA synthetase